MRPDILDAIYRRKPQESDSSSRPEVDAYFSTITSIMGHLQNEAIFLGSRDVRWQPDHPIDAPLPTTGPLSATFSADVDYAHGTSRRVRIIAEGSSVRVELTRPGAYGVADTSGNVTEEYQSTISFSQLIEMLDREDIIDNRPTETPLDQALFALRYAASAPILSS